MARTLPGGGTERTLLASGHVNIYAKLEVLDSDGVWRDLTNLSGFDWLEEWEVSESIDDPIAKARFKLFRESGALSIAPLVTASALNKNAALAYQPLVNPGRKFRFSTATVANGVAPVGGDYHELIQGVIGEVNPAGDENAMIVIGYDLGAYLQNTWIELQRTYGSTGGIDVQTVMQSIINDNAVPGAPAVVTPVSPGWLVTVFSQDRVSTLQALRDLALQIGWDIRYVYPAATNVPELRFYQPARTKVVPDWTIPGTEYTDLPSAPISDVDVRNAVTVVFVNAATGEILRTTRTNSTSIAIFGRRWMEIQESASSNIDTIAEANAMGDAAVSDLALPKIDHEMETLLFWPVQLGDLVRFSANGIHYDTDQDLAVVGFKHTSGVGPGDAKTIMYCRGAPAGAWREWLQRGKPNRGGEEGPTAGPPSIMVTRTYARINLEEVLVEGTVGIGGSGPLRYRYSSNGAPFNAWNYNVPSKALLARHRYNVTNVFFQMAQADGQVAEMMYHVGPRDVDMSGPSNENTTRGGTGGVPTPGKQIPTNAPYNRPGTKPMIDPDLEQVTGDLRANDGVMGIESARGAAKKSSKLSQIARGLVGEGRVSSGSGGMDTPRGRVHTDTTYDVTGGLPLIDPVTKQILPDLAIGPDVRGDSTVAFGAATKFPPTRHFEEQGKQHTQTRTFAISYMAVPDVRILPKKIKLPGTGGGGQAATTADRDVELDGINKTVSTVDIRAVITTGATSAGQSENPASTFGGSPVTPPVTITTDLGAAYWNLSNANSTLTTYTCNYTITTGSAGLTFVKVYKNTGTTDNVNWTEVGSRTYDAGTSGLNDQIAFAAAMGANWDIKIVLDKPGGSGGIGNQLDVGTCTYDKITAGTELSMAPGGYEVLVQSSEKGNA